ncbi:hypothetical protein RF11_01154 [Thelohanellus kitauei]|uniref:Tc1-like transposase DDE domain-containing protein n=1 Tax=Thelohanellus kitauei TaxID=669202 RepID=A0A0C2J5A6_THEKT|nr:hypothetical protein RF11_01154 [Thelohanellus kitauei]
MDETGFNYQNRRNICISRQGKCANITVSNSMGRHIRFHTVMKVAAPINYRSVVSLYEQTEQVKLFCHGLQQFSLTPKIFVMDNSRFNYSIELPKAFEFRGYRIVFLPLYYPQLNRIELIFSKRKRIIKSGMTVFGGNTLLATLRSPPIRSQKTTSRVGSATQRSLHQEH